MSELKKYSVTIFGVSYTIRSDKSEEHIERALNLLLRSIGHEHDNKMTVEQRDTFLSLAALQLASNCLELQEQQQQQEESCKKLIQTIEDSMLQEETTL